MISKFLFPPTVSLVSSHSALHCKDCLILRIRHRLTVQKQPIFLLTVLFDYTGQTETSVLNWDRFHKQSKTPCSPFKENPMKDFNLNPIILWDWQHITSHLCRVTLYWGPERPQYHSRCSSSRRRWRSDQQAASQSQLSRWFLFWPSASEDTPAGTSECRYDSSGCSRWCLERGDVERRWMTPTTYRDFTWKFKVYSTSTVYLCVKDKLHLSLSQADGKVHSHCWSFTAKQCRSTLLKNWRCTFKT